MLSEGLLGKSATLKYHTVVQPKTERKIELKSDPVFGPEGGIPPARMLKSTIV